MVLSDLTFAVKNNIIFVSVLHLHFVFCIMADTEAEEKEGRTPCGFRNLCLLLIPCILMVVYTGCTLDQCNGERPI